MAEEKVDEIAPPKSFPVPSPAQIINPMELIKALVAGQPPATAAPVSAGEGNYFASQAAAAEPIPPYSAHFGENLPTRTGVQELHGAIGKAKHLDLPVVAAATNIPNTPIAAIMAMDAHRVNPHVELAKQRVLQALMQRKGGIAPPPSPITPKGIQNA